MGFFRRNIGKASRLAGMGAKMLGKTTSLINNANRTVTKMSGFNPLNHLKQNQNQYLDKIGVDSEKRADAMKIYGQGKDLYQKYHQMGRNAYELGQNGDYAGMLNVGRQGASKIMSNYQDPLQMMSAMRDPRHALQNYMKGFSRM